MVMIVKVRVFLALSVLQINSSLKLLTRRDFLD